MKAAGGNICGCATHLTVLAAQKRQVIARSQTVAQDFRRQRGSAHGPSHPTRPSRSPGQTSSQLGQPDQISHDNWPVMQCSKLLRARTSKAPEEDGAPMIEKRHGAGYAKK